MCGDLGLVLDSLHFEFIVRLGMCPSIAYTGAKNQTEILRMLHLKSDPHLLGSFHGPGVKSPIKIRHNSNRENQPLV